MQEMVDQGIFDYVKDQKTDFFTSENKRQCLELFRQQNFMAIPGYIAECAQKKVKELVENFNLNRSDFFSALSQSLGTDLASKYAAMIKTRIIDGIENMTERFYELSGISILQGMELYSGQTDRFAKIQKLLNHNVKFFNVIAKLRFDVFNKLTRFLIDASKSMESLNLHWTIQSFKSKRAEGKSVDIIAPTECLLKELIESYPYKDTVAVDAEKSELQDKSPAFGCPAHKIVFPGNQGNMIGVFYRWYLKLLDENFFARLRKLANE